MSSNKQYWATMPAKEAVAECERRREEYYKYIKDKGFAWIWGLVSDFYHSATARQTLSESTGAWNELQSVSINDYRNLIQHKTGIIVNQKPTWEPIATNSDPKTLGQTLLAKNLLTYYTEVQNYSKKLTRCANAAAKFGEGFVVQLWDGMQGKEIAKLPAADKDGNETITTIFEGDVECSVYEPIDVIRDPGIMEQEQNHWFIIRTPKNKWDLAARYPEQYDAIVACSLKHDRDEDYRRYDEQQVANDLVYVYTLFHRKTAALPAGRILKYINADIILDSDPLSYKDYPVHRMVDVPIPGTNFSYTDSFDMLQVQDLIDGLWSTVITNQRAFGVQNIIMPLGSNISESQLGGALNVIEFDAMSGGKPEPLQLLATPPEIFKSIELLENKLETISSVNSTARGNPPTGVEAGVALSFLQSLNVQYNQGLQDSFINTMSSVGTALINLLQQNARTERVVHIVGTAKRSLALTFKGDDLNDIQRVLARPSNPMMQTVQGRWSLADMMAQRGVIKDPTMLLTVIETGSLDALTEGQEMSNINIKYENEMLREGKTVPVRPTDDHVAHLREHANITSDVHMRLAQPGTEEYAAIQACIAHEQEHMRFLGDPAFAPLLIALGQQPMVIQPGQIGSSGGQAAPTAAAQGPGGTTVVAPMQNAAGQAATAAGQAPAANQAAGMQNGRNIGPAQPGVATGQIPDKLIQAAQKTGRPPQQ